MMLYLKVIRRWTGAICCVGFLAFDTAQAFTAGGLCSTAFHTNAKSLSADSEKIVKTLDKFVGDNHRLPSQKELLDETGLPANTLKLILADDGIVKLEVLLATAAELGLAKKTSKLRDDLLKSYAQASKQFGRTISLEEFAEYLGTTANGLQWFFKINLRGCETFDRFRETAKKFHPKLFEGAIDRFIFTSERTDQMVQAIKSANRLIVTTAVAGAKVDLAFLAALETYARKNNAILIVIPADMRTQGLDEVLLEKDWIHILTNEIELSAFLRISNIKIPPTLFDPTTSLDDFGARSQSVIVGSPKLFVKTVATADNSLRPHMIFSTGAITLPQYDGARFIKKRRDFIAADKHRLGALVIERHSDGRFTQETGNPFHARHIEWVSEKESFFDSGRSYDATGSRAEKPLAIVFGDLHVENLDHEAFDAAMLELKRLKPKYLVLHDIFDGSSVNKYMTDLQISRAKHTRSGEWSLASEIRSVIEILNRILKENPGLEIVVDRSNHDLWLDRWLESGDFMRDPHNQAIGLILATAMNVQGVTNPLAYAVKELGKDPRNKQVLNISLSEPERVRFMEIGEHFTVGEGRREVALGFHGHAGVNGQKQPTLQTFNRANERTIFGHTHTVGRRNDSVNVGTLTKLNLNYNKDGLSNWVQSIAVVGPNGEIQVLVYNNGEFGAKTPQSNARKLFGKDYPRVKPNDGEEK